MIIFKPMDERQKRQGRIASPKNAFDKIVGLDLSSQGLKSLNASIFLLTTIKELTLNNNELETIPKDISKLKALEKLNLSFNKIRFIPAELGKTVSLKELYLNDNLISSVPMELGCLYNLEVFNLTNNPLIVPFNTLFKDKTLISFCRENNVSYKAPADRAWIDTVLRREINEDTISIGTYNILCNFYASKCTYAPSWVLNPDSRKDTIIQHIVSYNVDILGLQEIETYSYFDYFKEALDLKLDYDSVFLAKGKTLLIADKRTIDGCATFWKKSKYRLIEQVNVDFSQKIATDPRFSSNQDIVNRNARKENVALITVLEKINGTMIIVINTHLYWDPEFADVKLFQTIILIEEIEKVKQKYKTAPIVLFGDFNSLRESAVYNLITERKIDGKEFNLFDYGPFNLGFRHSLRFYDSYYNQDLTFTNFTPNFKDVIDYIFYGESLELVGVLSPIEEEYCEGCVGLPNIHFPSDHVIIAAKLNFKSVPRKPVGISK